MADVAFAADTAFTGNIPFYRLKGKVTGSKTRVNGQISGGVKYVSGEIRIEGETVLDGEKTVQVSDSAQYKPVEWLTSVSFYDKYGRVIESIANNSLGGNDTSRTEYDFPGKVLKTKSVHVSSVTTQTVKKRFEYDHAGRLLKSYQKNNADSEILLAYNQYNELGQLIDKSLHSANGGTSYLQSVDMRYNIRGWLKSINNRWVSNYAPNNDDDNDLFGMEFIYDWGDPGLNAVAQFNGNIADIRWKTRSTMVENAYGYQYDQLNQLKSAKFAYWAGSSWSTDNKYSTKNLVYDLNGNIKTMVQNFNGYLADSLTYTYKGNILLGVNDLVDNSASTNDFEDNSSKLNPIEGTPSTYEYLYDGNGNMIQDKNKNITVTYNFMNLPTKVNFGSGDSIVWVYTVSGAKLRKTVYDNGVVITTVDYVNGVQYKNGKMDFFFTEQGRVKKLANGNLRYEYDIKDHLGNTRVSFADTNSDGNAEILEESHYYAFGSRIEGLSTSSPNNKFTYNGKELEDDHGLNWYHYGARYYDPALGRWHAVDPVDEYNSPFTYVNNNPVLLTDRDGRSTDPPEAIVCGDAGHGGNNIGATGLDPEGNMVREEDLALYPLSGLRFEMANQNIKFVSTRGSDGTMPNGQTIGKLNQWRTDYAEEQGANVFVSFHMNTGKSNDGKIIIFYKSGCEESKILANFISAVPALNNLVQCVDIQNGTYPREFNGVLIPDYQPPTLESFNGASVLIEIGNINNPDDVRMMQRYGSDIGIAVGVGVGDYVKSK